jgi:hypothetical protein
MRKYILVTLIFILLNVTQASDYYRILPEESLIEVFLEREGLLTELSQYHYITNKLISGFVELVPDTSYLNTLLIIIYSKGFTVIDTQVNARTRAKIQKGMEGPDVLAVQYFPKISFEAVRIDHVDGDEYMIQGDLTIRNVTRRIVVPARVQFSGSKVKGTGEIFMKLSDFQLEPPSPVGGLIKVKDKFKVRFSIVAEWVDEIYEPYLPD